MTARMWARIRGRVLAALGYEYTTTDKLAADLLRQATTELQVVPTPPPMAPVVRLHDPDRTPVLNFSNPALRAKWRKR